MQAVTNPRNATTSRSSGQRFYSWRGENYWSVTTIIGGGLPKPALINWAKKFTAEYAIDNFDKLAVLVTPDESGAFDREGAVDWLKNAAFRDRDRKADLGTAVHEAIEAYILGKPMPPWAKGIEPRMRQFERFLADYEPAYEMTEASVYSRSQRYAGTLDAIMVIGKGPHQGRRFLNDVKSGKGVYPEVSLQMSAYRFADFIGLPDGSEAEMPTVDGACVLHLPDAGHTYELVDVRADEDTFRSFLYVREVFRFQTEIAKSVLLGPLRRADDPGEPSKELGLDPQPALASLPGMEAA